MASTLMSRMPRPALNRASTGLVHLWNAALTILRCLQNMSDQADTDNPYAVPDDYKPYVPVAKRRAQLLSRLGGRGQPKKKLKSLQDDEPDEEQAKRQLEDALEREREKARRERTLLEESREVKRRKEMEGG